MKTIKHKLFKWLSSKSLVKKITIKLFAYQIVWNGTPLTREHLLSRGFIQDENAPNSYYQPNIKDRDLITVGFGEGYYIIWHSDKRTYIATEKSIEWFEMYYLLLHGDNGRYKLTNV